MKAFPNQSSLTMGDTTIFGDGGMDLRDYFAAKAMQAFCSRTDTPLEFDAMIVAKGAYQTADAMMKAREAK